MEIPKAMSYELDDRCLLMFGGFKPLQLTNDFAALYTVASRSKRMAAYPLPPVKPGMLPAWRALFRAGGQDLPALRVDGGLWRYGAISQSKRALVAFSGGKDSCAAALRLAAEGYDVTLVHALRINPSLPQERTHAMDVAARLKLPLATVVMERRGSNDCAENPVKNHVILAMLADIAYEAGISNIAIGNTTDTTIETVLFDGGWSDCMAAVESAAYVIRQAIPGMTVHTELLRNETESLLTLIRHEPSLVHACVSCNVGVKRASIRESNVEKHGAVLLGRSCGSCAKCCAEAIIMHRLGYVTQSAGFITHCENVCRTKARAQVNRPLTDAEALDFYVNRATLETFL